MDEENRAQSRSESRVLVGKKREAVEAEDICDSSHKRVKLSDNESDDPSKVEDVNPESLTLDLNVDVAPISVMSGVDAAECIQESNTHLSVAKKEKIGRFHLDLNAEGITSSIKNNPSYPFKNLEHVNSRDDSECGSSMDEQFSLRVWKGLKENNYMSASRGVVPTPIPKTRGKKKNDAMKKKIELARKEQVDRFAKVAAPSGLLNGLNLGIINHVRNSKQVHSIIEALVRSETTEKKREIHTRGDHDSYIEEMRNYGRMPLPCNVINKDDELDLKLSSSQTVASENTSYLSNEESGNLSSVSSLSVEAANVASQWLELLNQDIRGRLVALRRSKKRVRAVITTELPLLLSNELSSDQASADAHAAKWSTLFGQMDKSLCEEESNLENWLNQVNEMQLLYERGISNSLYTASQRMDSDNRLGEVQNPEKDLAVRAAAASIYSTCNFLLTMGNQSCF